MVWAEARQYLCFTHANGNVPLSIADVAALQAHCLTLGPHVIVPMFFVTVT